MDHKFRIAISGDYLSFHSEEELMRLGFDELLPHRDLFSWQFLPKASQEEEVDPRHLEGFDALMLSGQYIRPRTLSPEVTRQLTTIARLGTGYDRIDLAACTEFDVVVFNSPHRLAHSAAFGAFALMLAVGRNLHIMDRLVREGRWNEKGAYIGADFEHKTLGVVGLGRIGRELVRLVGPLEMRLLAYDPYLTPERAVSFGAECVSLETLMAESDFVCVTCSLTAETTGLLDARQLALMKPSAYLINVARGAVIDQVALTRALSARKIAGAALDVFVEEPLPPDDPLTRLENVLLNPHAVASSREAGRGGVRDSVNGLVCIAQGQIPPDVVNPEVLTRPGFRAKMARHAACGSRRGYSDRGKATADEFS